jgi:hypothetical protein
MNSLIVPFIQGNIYTYILHIIPPLSISLPLSLSEGVTAGRTRHVAGLNYDKIFYTDQVIMMEYCTITLLKLKY